MERRGVYRKGSAGHARNVSSYRLARQQFKKWRIPLTGLLALMLVFGTAPVVGEQFQVSLLTADETVSLINTNPEQARKVFLSALHDFEKDCERFKMSDCVSQAKVLVEDVSNPNYNLTELFPAVEEFEERFAAEVSTNACRFDVGKQLVSAKSLQKKLQKFVNQYGEDFENSGFSEALSHVNGAVDALSAFVESCN